MREIDVLEAKENFDAMLVSIEQGEVEEVVITRGNTPVARLTKMKARTPPDDLASNADARALAMDRLVRSKEEITSAGLAFSVSCALHALLVLGNDAGTSLDYIKNSPLRLFGGKTALELIEGGRAEDVVDYLRSLSAGWVG